MFKKFIYVILFFPIALFSQYSFQGKVNNNQWKGKVYLSIIEDYRKLTGVFQEQIINLAIPDSTGFFIFKGDNLLPENRIFRIHVDACSEKEVNENHFNGHCSNSKEIIFIANNTETLYLPLSEENEMFCNLISNDEKARALLKIDSLKEEMKYEFASYRSEANQKLNSKKWFKKLQDFSSSLNEPLAELYTYTFLSNRSNELYSYYLEDLKTNNFYKQLENKLQKKYPTSPYTKQYSAELASDYFLVNKLPKSKNINWLIFLIPLLLASGVYHFFQHRKIQQLKNKNTSKKELLSPQEKKVLDFILQDKTNKEIANLMFVSLSTVKTHINNLYKKLQVTNREDVKSKYN